MSNSQPLVLVVDDNPANRQLATLMLRRLGYVAIIVGDGYEALRQCTAQQFDAILMDCMMPDLDGYETTVEIRRIEGQRGTSYRTPIIAVTANAAPGDRERCLAAGMDDYVTKPVRLQQLREAVERWVGRADAGDPVTDVPAETILVSS